MPDTERQAIGIRFNGGQQSGYWCLNLPLALVDLRLTSLMPIQAIQALLIDDALQELDADFAISFGLWQTAGIILAWTFGLSVFGVWRTLNSEIG